jgi:hypothetical protein
MKAYYANLEFFKSRLFTKHSKFTNCNKTNSGIRLGNLGAERIDNPEIASLQEENSKKNIWVH